MRNLSNLAALLATCCCAVSTASEKDGAANYAELRKGFVAPDHAKWGEVPLWWWEGQRMTKDRATAQLELLAAKGVKAVCPIQRSPGRCV